MINIETIKQRKSVYGDNFKPISESWSAELNQDITPKQVAKLMALMKQVRIDMTKQKIENQEYDSPYGLKDLVDSLEDSETDKANYDFIYYNFKEYEEL